MIEPTLAGRIRGASDDLSALRIYIIAIGGVTADTIEGATYQQLREFLADTVYDGRYRLYDFDNTRFPDEGDV